MAGRVICEGGIGVLAFAVAAHASAPCVLDFARVNPRLSFVGGHVVANVARKIPSVAKLMTSNAVTFDRITLFRASESISLKCAPTLSLAIDKISVAASDLARHRNICVAGIVSAARGKITSIDLNPVDRASGSAIVADALIEIKNAKKAS